MPGVWMLLLHCFEVLQAKRGSAGVQAGVARSQAAAGRDVLAISSRPSISAGFFYLIVAKAQKFHWTYCLTDYLQLLFTSTQLQIPSDLPLRVVGFGIPSLSLQLGSLPNTDLMQFRTSPLSPPPD